MPCLFGAFNPPADAWNRLNRTFTEIFGPLEMVTTRDGALAGHAHQPNRALRAEPEGRILGVYGERDLYLSDGLSAIRQDGPEGPLVFEGNARGVVSFYEPHHQSVTLASDWLSFFPLYYTQYQGGFLFSTHLKPLADAVGAAIDAAGLVEAVTLNWGHNGRTLFRGIRRLLSGQSLRYRVDRGDVSITETSRLWVDDAWAGPPVDVPLLWELITQAVTSPLARHEPLGIMMSGGWDSRILLAAAVATRGPKAVASFVHGEPRNAELRIARRAAELVGVRHIEIPLGRDAFGSPDDLDLLFRRSETLLFPYWRFAARRAVDLAIPALATGLLGEILGGHYTVHGGDALRISHFVKQTLLRREGKDGRATVEESFRQMFASVRRARIPWFLKPDFLADQADSLSETIEEDIEAVRTRYVKRGLFSPQAWLQAYVVEHRALMMLNSLPLTALAFTDVSMPFADRRLVTGSLSMSFSDRFERRLCQLVLRHSRPELLSLPLAATMGLPAGAPMLMHQGARLVRRGLDLAADRLSVRTHGRVSRTRPFGWMNFDEIMRDGEALETLTSDLAPEVFDHAAIARKIADVRAFRTPVKLGHVFLKMAYLHRMLAPRRG